MEGGGGGGGGNQGGVCGRGESGARTWNWVLGFRVLGFQSFRALGF